MDTIVKSLQLGFLLRSLVAGAYFVISYLYSGGGVYALLASSASWSFGASVALLSGVTVYSVHRAVLYPAIEHALNAEWATNARVSRPLVSDRTVEVLRRLWCAGSAKDKLDEAIARHVATWADYTHLLYATALAIAAGSVIRAFAFSDVSFEPDWLLAGLVAIVFLAALISDWRLHAVRERLRFGESSH